MENNLNMNVNVFKKKKSKLKNYISILLNIKNINYLSIKKSLCSN